MNFVMNLSQSIIRFCSNYKQYPKYLPRDKYELMVLYHELVTITFE